MGKIFNKWPKCELMRKKAEECETVPKEKDEDAQSHLR